VHSRILIELRLFNRLTLLDHSICVHSSILIQAFGCSDSDLHPSVFDCIRHTPPSPRRFLPHAAPSASALRPRSPPSASAPHPPLRSHRRRSSPPRGSLRRRSSPPRGSLRRLPAPPRPPSRRPALPHCALRARTLLRRALVALLHPTSPAPVRRAPRPRAAPSAASCFAPPPAPAPRSPARWSWRARCGRSWWRPRRPRAPLHEGEETKASPSARRLTSRARRGRQREKQRREDEDGSILNFAYAHPNMNWYVRPVEFNLAMPYTSKQLLWY
jgi:hypothetical protein